MRAVEDQAKSLAKYKVKEIHHTNYCITKGNQLSQA